MTKDELTAINAGDFSAIARNDPSLWQTAMTFRVRHADYGEGRIVGLEPDHCYIKLKFDGDSDSCKFNVNSFGNGKTQFLVPHSFEEQIHDALQSAALERQRNEKIAADRFEAIKQKRLAMDSALKAFKELTSKYDVPSQELFDGGELSPLGAILEKLEADDPVDETEIAWLESRDLQRLTALVHFRKYKRAEDYWALVKACKHLRKANLPKTVIDISTPERIAAASDPRIQSALLTTRGGAFRDISDLVAAKDSANKAIAASPHSFHPHNLLGAVLYEEGNPSDGDRSFERAVELGATPRNQDFEIRKALERSSAEARQKVISYLLQKDPERYSWVSVFAAAG